MEICPLLLNPDVYDPDSVDLNNDEEARVYWLTCLQGIGQQFVNKAQYLHPNDAKAKQKAEICRDSFNKILKELKEKPKHYGNISIRELLEVHETIVRRQGFEDAWEYQKHIETKTALSLLSKRLTQIDKITNHKSKWIELSKGIIAGNMFDWGAKAVLDLIENSHDFGFEDALGKIQPRPWLIDNLDEWSNRLERLPYSRVIIFVDNAGIDLILGVLPLVRELLKMGSKVICCSNSKPALNDVTNEECERYFQSTIHMSLDIARAIGDKRLVFYETGEEGPCLDLRKLNPRLVREMQGADLVILEGMGRAVHTNLYAHFKVDCLKVAVIKNEWWAKRLGGEKFSVLFKYEPAKQHTTQKL